MTQSRTELIDIVGRILCPDDWDYPGSIPRVIRSKHPLNLAKEIVTALRPEAKDPHAEIIYHAQKSGVATHRCSYPGCTWSRSSIGLAVTTEREALEHLKTHDENGGK